ncbi:MAG: CAP domain-containing protein [Acidimicrobiales bacterium]
MLTPPKAVRLLLVVPLLLLATAAFAPAAHGAPSARTGATTLVDAGHKLLDLVNADRAAAGLSSLQWRDDVSAIAVVWSQAMVAAGQITHNDEYFSAATQALLGSSSRGENVANTGSIEAADYGFMNSPHHRANMLDPGFTQAGFGVVQDGTGGLWITEDFVQSSGGSRATPAPVEPEAATVAVDVEPTTVPPPEAPTTTIEPIVATEEVALAPTPPSAVIALTAPTTAAGAAVSNMTADDATSRAAAALAAEPSMEARPVSTFPRATGQPPALAAIALVLLTLNFAGHRLARSSRASTR